MIYIAVFFCKAKEIRSYVTVEWIIDKQYHSMTLRAIAWNARQMVWNHKYQFITGLILWHFIGAAAVKNRTANGFSLHITFCKRNVSRTFVDVLWCPFTSIHSSYLHFSHFCLQHFLSQAIFLFVHSSLHVAFFCAFFLFLHCAEEMLFFFLHPSLASPLINFYVKHTYIWVGFFPRIGNVSLPH